MFVCQGLDTDAIASGDAFDIVDLNILDAIDNMARLSPNTPLHQGLLQSTETMSSMSPIQRYKQLLDLIERDGDIVFYLHSLTPDDLQSVIEYLVKFKHAREKSVQESEKKRRAELGVASSWHRVKNDPEKYQRRLANNRLYRQRKKRAALDATHGPFLGKCLLAFGYRTLQFV